MSASSPEMPSGRKSPREGSGRDLRGVRSHALSSARCLIDLTAEGSALANSMTCAADERLLSSPARTLDRQREIEKRALYHRCRRPLLCELRSQLTDSTNG